MIITSTPEALRAWAKGMYTTEAAAELLIRGFGGRFAQTAYPWIHPSESGGYWIDLAAIPDNIGAYSSGERGYLLIAASIGSSEVQVNLSDAVASLGREQLDLVLAAIAHAAGSHQHSKILYDPDGRPASFGKLDTLYP